MQIKMELMDKVGMRGIVCLHTFHSGQPNKFKHLKRAFAFIASHDNVWLTTGDDVNDWYHQNYM
ncbi:MAG: hypothetical protein CL798_07130 [Chromatiales bacterium]|jgi:hypothetical protein|nr:hypothetical protein [Chromatiales bacterium]